MFSVITGPKAKLCGAKAMFCRKSQNYVSSYNRRSGGPRRIRTPDPLIRSQVLYPAELSVHCGGCNRSFAQAQPQKRSQPAFLACLSRQSAQAG